MTDDTLDLPTRCPFCGEQHECVSAALEGRREPDDGDITICWQCGKAGLFDSKVDGRVRKPTKHEQRGLGRDERLQQILTAWRKRFQ